MPVGAAARPIGPGAGRNKILERRGPAYTGDRRGIGKMHISYRLYAFHYPTIIDLSILFVGMSYWPRAVALLPTSVPLSLLIASGASRLIEQPFQRLGRRLTSMQPAQATAPACRDGPDLARGQPVGVDRSFEPVTPEPMKNFLARGGGR
jgi:peptidoglycan/LPS O-acetylase OafA/YrhL